MGGAAERQRNQCEPIRLDDQRWYRFHLSEQDFGPGPVSGRGGASAHICQQVSGSGQRRRKLVEHWDPERKRPGDHELRPCPEQQPQLDQPQQRRGRSRGRRHLRRHRRLGSAPARAAKRFCPPRLGLVHRRRRWRLLAGVTQSRSSKRIRTKLAAEPDERPHSGARQCGEHQQYSADGGRRGSCADHSAFDRSDHNHRPRDR